MVDLLVCTLQDGRYGEGDLKKKKEKGAILVIKYNNQKQNHFHSGFDYLSK